MTRRLEGKVALITGGARGQGRAHAIRLAEEGASIIAVDICAQIESTTVPMPTPEDLDETADNVRAIGAEILTYRVDVRDYDALAECVGKGVSHFGRLDVVSAGAGIQSFGGTLEEMPEQTWQDMIDVNLTGVWHTTKAATPHLIDGGRGGSIVITSSGAGAQGIPNAGHYVAAKHGLVGLTRTLALELAPHHIRVNVILPGMIDTVMLHNKPTYDLFMPELDESERTREEFRSRCALWGILPDVPWLDSRDISNAVLWFASDESRYVTGVALPVDAGVLVKPGAL